MNYNITTNMKHSSRIAFLMALSFFVSCGELDRDFKDEELLSSSHASAINEAGGTVGLQALDGAILSYLRDGESSADEFGLKAVDIGMDLRSNDMDMSRNTWFGSYNNYDNIVLTSSDPDFMWEFFYKVINNANGIINTIPDTSPEETLVYKYKSMAYRGIAYFYLIRIFQHTRAADATLAIPIDFGDFVGEDKSTVGAVKAQILADLTAAYDGLQSYSRSSKEEIDASVVAAYLARYYLTYENWSEAERFASIAMAVGSIESNVIHGYDDLSLSEVVWGAQVTEATSEVYASFFSHMSQINDGYSGWNHYKTVNSNLYDRIPATDARRAWFADREYNAGEIVVPNTWSHYNITPKYTSLKFIAEPGPGVFIGDYIYLRNTEFYLTKAEALARLGRDSEAQQALFELNSVRDSAYLKSTATGQALIDEILLYRRIELWGDGVASFDMARLGVGLNRQDGRTNLVMPGADLVIPTMDDRMIFQIPLREVDATN